MFLKVTVGCDTSLTSWNFGRFIALKFVFETAFEWLLLLQVIKFSVSTGPHHLFDIVNNTLIWSTSHLDQHLLLDLLPKIH